MIKTIILFLFLFCGSTYGQKTKLYNGIKTDSTQSKSQISGKTDDYSQNTNTPYKEDKNTSWYPVALLVITFLTSVGTIISSILITNKNLKNNNDNLKQQFKNNYILKNRQDLIDSLRIFISEYLTFSILFSSSFLFSNNENKENEHKYLEKFTIAKQNILLILDIRKPTEKQLFDDITLYYEVIENIIKSKRKDAQKEIEHLVGEIIVRANELILKHTNEIQDSIQ